MSTAQQRLEEIAKQEQALANEKAKLLEASKDAARIVANTGNGQFPNSR